MVHRYDLILLAIPVVLLAGWLLGALTPVPQELGLVAGVLLATPFVYDAMFGHPPLPESDSGRVAAAIVWHALLAWTILSALT